jgi:hypothetical protein
MGALSAYNSQHVRQSLWALAACGSRFGGEWTGRGRGGEKHHLSQTDRGATSCHVLPHGAMPCEWSQTSPQGARLLLTRERKLRGARFLRGRGGPERDLRGARVYAG